MDVEGYRLLFLLVTSLCGGFVLGGAIIWIVRKAMEKPPPRIEFPDTVTRLDDKRREWLKGRSQHQFMNTPQRRRPRDTA